MSTLAIIKEGFLKFYSWCSFREKSQKTKYKQISNLNIQKPNHEKSQNIKKMTNKFRNRSLVSDVKIIYAAKYL